MASVESHVFFGRPTNEHRSHCIRLTPERSNKAGPQIHGQDTDATGSCTRSLMYQIMGALFVNHRLHYRSVTVPLLSIATHGGLLRSITVSLRSITPYYGHITVCNYICRCVCRYICRFICTYVYIFFFCFKGGNIF